MIIGIDLGTTNSLVAYFTKDGPEIIPNAFGETMTPSVVSVDENNHILVGKIAKERLLTHPTYTASVFKRHMGTKKKFILGNQSFIPEELSSIIIRRLKEDAESYINKPITEAVVSVPAYFSDAQRRATKTAGELAGLKVERIVNEPTCAALAYGLHEKVDYTKFLVFDLGGGTFDVSILEKYKNVMEVRAVAGDNYLGGEDFTQVLVNHFAMKHDLDLAQLTPIEMAALTKTAESAKLSISDSSTATMRFLLDDEELSATITGKQYEKYCEPLFLALRNPIKRALSDANLQLSDINSVLLVGGATKLPLIRSFVGKLLGRFPSSHINQDEVVALGAAIHGALKARDESLTEIVLTDVCPYTLGTEIAVMRPNGIFEPGHYAPIIERNATVPISRVERFYTLGDNQNKISSAILQGESRKANDNIKLGEITVPVPPAPAGKESVDIRFTYDINGILEAEVKVVSTGITEKAVIQNSPGTLTPEELAEKVLAMQMLKIHPREKEEYRFLLAWGERLYEESRGDRRKYIEDILRQYDDMLDAQDEQEIRDFSQELREILTDFEMEL